jgi:hypothetical protein
MRKHRGAPLHNQNARKHGFYSNVLSDSEKANLKKAALVNGLDEEINLLRVKIKSVAETDSKNVKLISQAIASLSRVLKARDKLVKKDDNMALQNAIENTMRDIGIPCGALLFDSKKWQDRHPDIVKALKIPPPEYFDLIFNRKKDKIPGGNNIQSEPIDDDLKNKPKNDEPDECDQIDRSEPV